MILELIGCMRRGSEEDERRIPILLADITRSFDEKTAVVAEQAVKEFRAAIGTSPVNHPKLWRLRFQRFIDLTEQIYRMNGIADTDTICT